MFWKILVSIQIPIWKGTKITILVPILYNILVLPLKMYIISIGFFLYIDRYVHKLH